MGCVAGKGNQVETWRQGIKDLTSQQVLVWLKPGFRELKENEVGNENLKISKMGQLRVLTSMGMASQGD